MSYILSALKKAEQERHSGDVPGVLTPQVGTASSPASPAERVLSPYYLYGAVAAAVLLFGLWMGDMLRRDDAAEGVVVQEAPSRAVSAPASAPPPVLAPVRDSVRALADSADDEPVFGDGPAGAPAADPEEQWTANGEILDVARLPLSLREKLPNLKLTGHLYSLGHPNARKVILNGVALKEQQYLDDDLMVSEITHDGVILEFRGRLLRLGADQMFR